MQTELLRFHSLEIAQKVPRDRCPTRDVRCLVEGYAADGVQIVVTGALGPERTLRYGVYETWTGSRAFEGSMRIAGITTATLEREIDQIARRIVQRGGLLDQRPGAPNAADTSPAPRVLLPARMSGTLVPILVAATILVFAAPILLVLALVGSRELGRRATPRSWKWSAIVAVALSAFWMAAALVDTHALVAHLSPRAAAIGTLSWPIAAGILWGALVLTLGMWILAPLQGLERVRDDALWPILRAWLGLALLRAAALFAMYAPVFELTRRACALAALPDRLTWAIALPSAGLLLHFWLLSLVDNLSAYLDVALVLGPATTRNSWHATIKRYLRGYVRRNVISLDAGLLDRALFLPSARPGVACYGGGFATPRIVVGEKAVETALGELPDEEEFPDRTANPEELPLGLVLPATGGAEANVEARAEAFRHRVSISPPRKRAYMPRLVGQNATLLGWVLPQSIAEGIPLISDTEEDFGVVKRLLSEHYAAFQLLSHDDEVDDTDPTQKDFLFGPLLRALGIISRHDVLFATVGLTLDVVASRRRWFSYFARLPLGLYERLLAAPATKVADAYVALNGAVHNLIQYLCFARGTDEELLTARANAPRLNEASRKMIKELDVSKPTAEERDVLRTTARDRVAWLARIFLGPIGRRRFRWLRVLGGVALGGVAAALLLRSVQEAVAYHPIYVQRMSGAPSPPPPTERENAR